MKFVYGFYVHLESKDLTVIPGCLSDRGFSRIEGESLESEQPKLFATFEVFQLLKGLKELPGLGELAWLLFASEKDLSSPLPNGDRNFLVANSGQWKSTMKHNAEEESVRLAV